MEQKTVTLLIKCPDREGIIATLTGFFYKEGFNIISLQQYTNVREKKFFMRICLTTKQNITIDLEEKFDKLSKSFDIEWKIDYGDKKQKVAIMVSHTNHNLYDLLSKYKEGILPCEVVLVVSNHEKLRPVAEMFGIPYYYAPVNKETRNQQEAELKDLFDKNEIDLIVMARYMQILTSDFISHYPYRIINIHHSFLPAFQGANPYMRAYERGVKLIGATAHYATQDLDEGPIIEQDVERVTHESTVSTLKSIGADIETMVLSRAVKFHLNNQIIVDGNKTIVFPET
ncbi:formyltetrahydrofolate deformylase [Aestuariivivens marinum]|uniref:formyltetrahydrofolate deformylase n=1 Tax=Aestuariivivens marinum TaxID=2913555 RepID=UPI001F5A993C|nr:formyltetrahydrofolate deformylase [Aestuariivivens marinum]